MISISIATAIAGLGIGVIVGRLTNTGALQNAIADADYLADTVDDLKSDKLGLQAEIVELRAFKARVLKGLRAANAARSAKAAARRIQETELRNERHAELRALVGDLV